MPACALEVTIITQQRENTGTKDKPKGMRVLVANEPLAYREVISAAFKELRPQMDVHTTEPVDLDKELLRLAPGLVVCSRTTVLVEHKAPAWVELYREHTSGAIVSLAGTKTTFDEMDFGTLLSILDEAEHLCESV